ncbi:MAG: M18 family aminopeptidase [Sphaerochaetaceae bacterium]|nr:M18 family aminopeptidase [Sphaerochaetaceae bacterium]
METKYIEETQNLIDFINKSYSPFHVVENVKEILNDRGFEELLENEKFTVKRGGKYYVTRNSSSLIAFKIPESFVGYSIIASHTDSPSFKVKANPEMIKDGKFTTLNVEGYGGMLCAPWFDRPLSIAGRVFVENGDEVEQRLLNFDKDMVSIVNLAIHQNREANTGYKYSKQKDMLPILGLGENSGELNKLIAKNLGVDVESILDSDLFLYNRMNGTIWGLDDEFFSTPKLDDLGCVYPSVRALIDTEPSNTIPLIALFDNEEVGSGTKQGALSDFLPTVIERISFALSLDVEQKAMMKANSFMLSADNGHALHPNYMEKSDPVNHTVPGGGIVIKYAANQKYTTDAQSAAFIKKILKDSDVPYQEFTNNSDVAGGSTLGNLSNQHYSLNTVDIGCSQLAMHSPYETGGTKDVFYMITGMSAFLKR